MEQSKVTPHAPIPQEAPALDLVNCRKPASTQAGSDLIRRCRYMH